MTTVLTVNIDDIDNKFVETLKRDFAHAEVEIRLEGQTEHPESFTTDDFWNTIHLLDWSNEGDDAKVVKPVVDHLSGLPLSHIYRFSDILAEKLWQLDIHWLRGCPTPNPSGAGASAVLEKLTAIYPAL